MSNDLELLHEGFQNEVNELDSLLQYADEFMLKAKRIKYENLLKNIVSNLNGLCDSLYNAFEESNESELAELREQNKIMRELLRPYLPESEKTYIRLKHGIDVEGWS